MVEEEERLIHDNIDNIIRPCISDDSKSILFKMGEDECKSEDQVLFLS